MEGMITAHTSPHRRGVACWYCFQYHRSCDRNRPCSTCIARNRGSECHDPLPSEKINQTMKRKRKRESKKKEEEEAEEGEQTRKWARQCNHFFIVSAQSFSCSQPLTSHDPSSSRILHQIQQLTTATHSLMNEQAEMKEQLSQIHQSMITTSPLPPPSPPPSPLQTSAPLSPFLSPPIHLRIVSEDFIQPLDVLNQMLDELENKEEEEQHLVSREEPFFHHQTQSLLPWKDSTEFGQSAFMPFVLQSPTLPFLVTKLLASDWRPLVHRWDSQAQAMPQFQLTLLAANESFFRLVQYNEDEILGANIRKLYPPLIRVAESPRFIPHMLPPPLSTQSLVSPARTTYFSHRAQDGTFIHSAGKIQFFYSSEDGSTSFMVLQLLRYLRSTSSINPLTPTSSTSPEHVIITYSQSAFTFAAPSSVE